MCFVLVGNIYNTHSMPLTGVPKGAGGGSGSWAGLSPFAILLCSRLAAANLFLSTECPGGFINALPVFLRHQG